MTAAYGMSQEASAAPFFAAVHLFETVADLPRSPEVDEFRDRAAKMMQDSARLMCSLRGHRHNHRATRD